MRLARSGLEIRTVADLGLKAALRSLGAPEDRAEPPAALPPFGYLPLPLTQPPEPGEALSFLQEWPHRWVHIWQSVDYPNYFHVVALESFGIDQGGVIDATDKPVAWSGIASLLDYMRIEVRDITEVERVRGNVDLWERVRRCADNPFLPKNQWKLARRQIVGAP
jgi:hypothetical protein